MSLLVVNGVTLDSYLGASAVKRIAPLLEGGRRSAFAGGLRDDVIAQREGFQARCVPSSQEEALALEGWLEGLGEVWTFDDDYYSVGGMNATISGETIPYAGKHGNAVIPTDADLAFECGDAYVSAWSVWLWYFDGVATWDHYLIRSDGSAWKNGGAVAAPGWLTVSGGTFTLAMYGAPDPGWALYDDLVIVPYSVPSSWVASIFAEHTARGWQPLPKLRVTGDLVPDSPRAMRGEWKGAGFVAHVRSGAFTRENEAPELLLEDW